MIRPRFPRMRPDSGMPILEWRPGGAAVLWHRAYGPASAGPGRTSCRWGWLVFDCQWREYRPRCRCLSSLKAFEGRNALSGFREDIQAAIPALRRYARALTHERESADDLVQDTLVRALRSEHLFHGGEIRNWLFTILINLNRNRLRTLARRPQYAPLEEADAPDMAGPGGGGRDVARALATLPEDQRATL